MKFTAEIPNLLKIAIPIAITRLINAANIFIGMIFIARLGTTALAAGNLITSFYTTILLVSMGILFSGGILISNAMGQKKFSEVGKYLQHGVFLAFLISICSITLMLNIKIILVYLKQETEIINVVVSYMHYAALGIFPCLAVVVINQFLISIGRPLYALLSTMATLPLNITLGYCLVLGKYGFINMGASGVAFAIAINFWIVFLGLCYYLFVNKTFKQYAIFKDALSIDKTILKNLFFLGLPISIQFGTELFAFSFAAIFMGWLGIEALAAQQIVIQASVLAGILPFSIAQACAILTGKQGTLSAKNVWASSIICASVITSLIAILYIVFPNIITNLYIDPASSMNKNILHLTYALLFIAALNQIADSIRNITAGSLSGLKDTKYPMTIALFVCWLIALPLGYLFGFTWHIGAIGVFSGFTIAYLVGSGLLISHLFKKIARLNFKPKDYKGETLSPNLTNANL